jgi:hypothetical protein
VRGGQRVKKNVPRLLEDPNARMGYIRMPRDIAVFVAYLCLPSLASAQNDDSAEFFSHIYWSLCKSNAGNPDFLRAKLKTKGLPELPPEKAKLFTGGADGYAWPVPHSSATGNFVLALPAGKRLCAVYARRADAHLLELLFSQFGENPPAPTVADRQHDVYADSGPNGKTHTMSYIWSTPGDPAKLLFMLTTSESPSAEVQALGTVSVIGN